MSFFQDYGMLHAKDRLMQKNAQTQADTTQDLFGRPAHIREVSTPDMTAQNLQAGSPLPMGASPFGSMATQPIMVQPTGNFRNLSPELVPQMMQARELAGQPYAEMQKRSQAMSKRIIDRQNDARIGQVISLFSNVTPEQQELAKNGFGREVAKQLIKSETGTTAMKNANALGLSPSSDAYKEYIHTATKPMAVNVSTGKTDNEWKKAQIKSQQSYVDKFRQQVTSAPKRRDNINQLMRLNSQLAVNQAKGMKSGTNLQMVNEFVRSAGLPWDLTGQYKTVDEFQKLSGRLIKEELDKSKGPQTDSDREFLVKIMPNVNSDPESNAQLLNYMQSRELLDSLHMDVLDKIGLKSNFMDSEKYRIKHDKSYRNTSTVMTLPNGKPYTFFEFMNDNRGNFESSEDALDNWRTFSK